MGRRIRVVSSDVLVGPAPYAPRLPVDHRIRGFLIFSYKAAKRPTFKAKTASRKARNESCDKARRRNRISQTTPPSTDATGSFPCNPRAIGSGSPHAAKDTWSFLPCDR